MVAEAGAAITCHVATHHALSQARLKWLIDHAAVLEILSAPTDKIIQRQFLGCVLGRVQHPDHRPGGRQPLDFPHALTAVAPVALDHARAGGEPRRQFGAHRVGRLIQRRIAPHPIVRVR